MAQLTPWGSTITYEVSSAAPDADPVWVDLSDYLRPARSEIDIQLGRQTELDAAEPGRASLVLDNGDLPERFPSDPWAPAGRFTPGNALAPTFPWWKQARRCRIRETIAGRTFDLFDGHIEIPQVNAYMQPADDDGPADMLAPVAAVDRLGRLQNARTFVSTLAEHIIFNGGSDLIAYYPLNEPTLPLLDITNNQPNLTPRLNYPSNWPSATAQPSYTLAGGTPAPGDDAPGLLITPAQGAGYYAYMFETVFGNFSFSAGQKLTYVFWFRLGPGFGSDENVLFHGFGHVLESTAFILFRRSGGPWKADLFTASTGLTGSVEGGNDSVDVSVPVAVQIGYSPNSLELWVGRDAFTTTPTGTLTSPQSLFFFSYQPGPLTGAISHAQVYIGNSFTRQKFLDQHNVGLNGLERQTTGARINTILDCAGVPAGMRDIDPGVAVMQRASLAGTSPGDQLENARATERGRLFVAGDGRVTFRDRRSLYNI